MNCHGSKNENKNGHNGHGKHMLLMALGCLVPIALLLILPFFNVDSPILTGILPFAIFLLCPLMHVFMMVFMFRKDKKDSSQDDIGYNNVEHLPLNKFEDHE